MELESSIATPTEGNSSVGIARAREGETMTKRDVAEVVALLVLGGLVFFALVSSARSCVDRMSKNDAGPAKDYVLQDIPFGGGK